jgi:hypothetical protein
MDVGNDNKNSEKYGEYIGAYVGDDIAAQKHPQILTSSFDSTYTTHILAVMQENAGWYPIETNSPEYFRCVYDK